MNWYYIIGFFALVMFLRFITNFYKYIRIKNLFEKYIEYINTDNYKFIQNKEEIKSLFKDANLKDSSVFHQEFFGLGKFSIMRISVFDNLTNRREDIVGNIQNRFNEAIGVFRNRFRESFNPFFWLDFIVKFPQHIMKFFGVLPEKTPVKIFLLVYWILALILGLKKFELLEYLIK